MASVRDIRKRIKSVKSTQKITKAMKMVAAARLRRAQEAAEQANPYSRAIAELLQQLSGNEQAKKHPLMAKKPVEKKLYVVFSSDRGLCGAFNSALFRQLQKQLSQVEEKCDLLLLGKKAGGYFSARGYSILENQSDFWTQFDHEKAMNLVKQLQTLFLQNDYQEIILAYNEFESVMSQIPRFERLFPLSTPAQNLDDKESQGGAGEPSSNGGRDIIFEPTQEELLLQVIPKAIEVKLYRACLHSQASEYGARMAAMDSASRNAGEMIDDLTLTMNRLRQANITTELVEIISGAEALKGA